MSERIPVSLAEFMVGRTLFSYITGMLEWEAEWLETNPASLDLMLKLNYGDREVWWKYAELTDSEVAIMLVSAFNDSWKALSEAAALAVLNSKRTVTETITQTDSRTNTGEETSKVSAFNSEDLIEDQGRSTTGTDALQSSRTRDFLDETLDVKQKLSQLDDASRRNVVQSVVKDVASYLTISIY